MVAGTAVEGLNQWREEKTLWAYNKDYFQRALLRRDWYLKREEETVKSERSDGGLRACGGRSGSRET